MGRRGLDADHVQQEPRAVLDGDIARAFFEDVVAQARGRRLLSEEHFTADGTLLEAWAGQKSFTRKDRPGVPPEDPAIPPSISTANGGPM